MEEYLKKLDGITYKEWRKIKIVVDNGFAEIKEKNTLTVSENVLENLRVIT